MADILRLENLNLATIFLGVLVILAGVNAIAKIITEFSKVIGKPIKWVKSQDDESLKVKRLEEQMGEFGKKLNSLTEIVVSDRVDRMRYEILDMASAISESKRWYSVEQLKHTLKVYDEYEKFLEEHDLENGEVDLSIQIIREAYIQKYSNMEKGALKQ